MVLTRLKAWKFPRSQDSRINWVNNQGKAQRVSTNTAGAPFTMTMFAVQAPKSKQLQLSEGFFDQQSPLVLLWGKQEVPWN